MHKTLRSRLAASMANAWLALLLVFATGAAIADTPLSNLPLYSASNVPANLMLALSVEFPTGTVGAYTNSTGYSPNSVYLGYFDGAKCYTYDTANKYFVPNKKVVTDCTGFWSGNMLNWAMMTALDEFRQTLTGGNRSKDTATLTVLIRSNLNSQSTTGNFPDKHIFVGTGGNVAPSTVIGDTAYSSLTDVYLRSSGQGSTFLISNNSGFATGDVKDGKGKVIGKNFTATYNAQVQVCASAALLESNCTKYGSNYKPEGLIQQNYQRIRVGASAYAFYDGSAQPNGVVRALLRDNGPTKYNGNGKRQANPYQEWSAADGTFFTNPASGDSSTGTAPGGGAFSQSGTINYLNQFGSTGGGTAYELYDTISDLYWATLAYYQHVPLDSTYSAGLTTTNSLDVKFPVFTGTVVTPGDDKNAPVLSVNDPMQYTCQANAIVVIGDSHTHCDSRVPSSGGPTGFAGQCKNTAALAPVAGADAAAYTTKLGKLPLIEANNGVAASKTMAQVLGSDPGTSFEPNTTNSPTFNIAGLAYFAHTNDVRSDLTGTQTVDTYVVDVMEPGAYDGTSGRQTFNLNTYTTGGGSSGPNAYWLAAKYGGFNDVNNNGLPFSVLTWHTNTSTQANGDLRPDNYFVGNRPDLIKAGLSQIFSHVSSTQSLSAAGPSVSPTRVLSLLAVNTAPYFSSVAGFPIYTTAYIPGAWSGDISGFVATADVGADVSAVPGSAWSAQAKLDILTQYTPPSGSTIGWKDSRRVITWSGTAGIPFRYNSLSTAQQAALGSKSDLVDFLRGDKTNEGTKYNSRSHSLGDIVNSQATLVQGAASPSYSAGANPGYPAFAATLVNRQPVVYVGANDGMLHAFAADFTAVPSGNPLAGGGSELFAYVPGLVFNGPNGTPQVDGLAALGNLAGSTTNPYSHHFYVDQTPQVADVDFGRAFSAPGMAATGPDWRTLLVGGLGKGGKGIYALDVTSVPSEPQDGTGVSDEATIKAKALWEFTDADMGYSYARPLIAKTRKYGWVVLLTSGYNNPSGLGHLYVINAKTGVLLEKLDTTAGDPTNQSGLSRPSAYTQDVSDNTVEQVYAGDLLGNVWRFDLSGTGDYPKPTVLATLTDKDGTPQPITTAPRIEIDLTASSLGTRRWVFVGTGKFLDTSDLTDTQQQTMYALRDGDSVAPTTTGLPITRASLVASDLTTDLSLGDTASGWYFDLTGTAPGTGGATERIVVDPDAVAGIFTVSWATLIPTADPCSLQGAIYSVGFATGRSSLLDAGGNFMKSISTASATTNLQMVQLPNGKFVLLYGQTGQSPQTANMVQPGDGLNVQRTNWREILNAQ